MSVCSEFDPFLFQDPYPAVDDLLFQFEIRNAIAEKPADLVIPFENRDLVTGTVELLGSGKACRT